MGWRIDYDGHTFREGDLTIGQAEQMEMLTGQRWTYIDPKREASHARAVLSVMLADATAITVDQAGDRVRALKVDAFLDMLTEEPSDMPEEWEDGVPPKADEPSTST